MLLKLKQCFNWIVLALLLSWVNGYAQEKTLNPADSLFYHEIHTKAAGLMQKDIDSALYYLDRLHTYLLEKDYPRKRFRVLLEIGNAYMSKGQTDRALETYMEIAGDSALADASEFRLYAAISIAGIYLESEDHQKALEQYQSIRTQYKVTDSTYINLLPFAVMSNNEGIANENLGNLNEAERLYEQAIAISTRISAPYDLANAYSNMGSLKGKTGNNREALEWHQKALKIRRENALSLGMAQSYAHIGDIYFRLGDLDQAEAYLMRSVEISGDNGYSKLIIETAGSLKSIFRDKGDFKQAFEIQEREMQAQREILNKESLRNQERLKAKYEYELEKQIEEKNRRIRETVWGFAFGFLVLLLVIAVISFWLQKSKTRQSELKTENIRQEKLLLRKELEYKNKKLMSNLMFLLQKNELISGIIQKLREAKKLKKTESDKMIRDIIMNLKHHHSNETWEEFDLYFQEVHSDFYSQLSSRFQLTPNELKLAAFTKLQLSSKEISSLTGQSVRTIDVGRYRLRKKLGLTNADVNLTTFLNSL